MKRIEVQKSDIDLTDYKLRSALESDYSTLIKESCVIYCNGEPKIIYKNLDEEDFDESGIVKALKAIKYEQTTRTGGLKTTSRIFGYAPRVVMRKDFCSATSLVQDFPKEHQVICEYGKKVAELYRETAPKTFVKHKQVTDEKVLKDWQIEDTPFTSGIVNKNNPLKYHYDSGNFNEVYSCMLGFKHNTSGGYLSIPEYDLALEIKNNSVLIFDGQQILHGVTPIKLLSEDSYRFTIVYYSLKQMWNCLPLNDEVIRIRNLKTLREIRRAEALAFKNIR